MPSPSCRTWSRSSSNLLAGHALVRLFGDQRVPANTAAAPSRLIVIDGLRGLAAVAVVVYHYLNFLQIGPGAGLPNHDPADAPFGQVLGLLYQQGHRAVPLFWMISGLVLAHVYCGRTATGRSFVVNRFARLYPLHLLTLIVVAALQVWALARLGTWPVYQHNDAWHFGLNLLLASNWGIERGYSFNGPIWSVSVEILAYALFWLLHRDLLRWGVAMPLAVSLGALLAIVVFGDSDGARCLFYFFLGTALAAIRRSFADSIGVLVMVAASLMVVGITGLIVAVPGFTHYVVLPGLFGGTILALSVCRSTTQGRFGRACAALGDRSYGIYLWHFPIQLALIVLLSPAIDLPALAGQMWFLLSYLGLVLLVAHLSLIGFERPWRARLRRWGEGPARRLA